MSNKYIYYSKNNEEKLEAYIHPMPNWEDFDKLIQYLMNEFAIKVIEKIDGPGSRRWILECDGILFELIYDDGYGNYLLASSRGSQQIIHKIGNDLEERFRRVE